MEADPKVVVVQGRVWVSWTDEAGFHRVVFCSHGAVHGVCFQTAPAELAEKAEAIVAVWALQIFLRNFGE